MPKIRVCEKCGDAFWEDVPCQTCAESDAKRDAVLFGSGWLRIRPDGAKERIAPKDIYLKPKPEDQSGQ